MIFYLHVGMPKTGTTTIQAFLESNRDRLAERGIVVPRATGFQNHRKLTAYALDDESLDHTRRMMGLLSPDQLAQFRRRLQKKLAAEAAAWPADSRVVMSGENMSQLRQPQELARLHELLAPHGAEAIRIVVYLRRQDLFYLSSYSQQIKAGRSTHWSELAFDAKKRLYDYVRFLAPWSAQFGKENIVVRAFERSQFVNHDLLSDFLSTIGADSDLSAYEIPETQNQSLDAQTAEYLRQMNPHFPRYIDNVVSPVRRELVAAMEVISSGPKLRMAADFASSFLSQFEHSNATIARDYLGREDGILFREVPEDAGETPPMLSVEQSIEISAKLWARAYGKTAPVVAEPAMTTEPADPPEPAAGEKQARKRQRKQRAAEQAQGQIPSDADTPPAEASWASVTLRKPLSIYAQPQMPVGVHQLSDDIACEVLAERQVKRHTHIRGSYPAAYPFETEFVAGPVLVFKMLGGYTDPQIGVTIARDGSPVRESAVVERLIDTYAGEREGQSLRCWSNAASEIVLPIATQRKENYCRWWLDSISKIFIASRSSLLGEDFARGNIKLLSPQPSSPFQQQSLEMLRSRLPLPWMNVDAKTPLIAATAANSPGITFGGGQNLGALTDEYSQYLQQLLLGPELPERPPGGDLLYVSRNDSGMRRILNEEQLLPGLRDLGFNIVMPAELSLLEQLLLFRNARVIVSAHGAGLTNLLFSQPGTSLVEIFPEGGVHGSAFLRICSHRDFDYYFIVGDAVATKQSAKNPNNADIVIDVASSLALIRDVVWNRS